MPLPHRHIALSDRSAIGEARRVAMSLGNELGFSEEQRSNVGIVVTEAATNVILHAGGGEMLLCAHEHPHGNMLDLLTLDRGPGIRDVAEASRDGFSSRGTAGEGLGAITRQSDDTGIYTTPGGGTVNWSRFLQGPAPPHACPLGVICIPLLGEAECGDAYLVCRDRSRTVYMVVDGLGHGPHAAEAARAAVETTRTNPMLPPREILLLAHDALRKTRGAAMAVAAVDFDRRTLTYAGVGNIGAMIEGPGQRGLVSHNGTVGAVLPRTLHEYTYPFDPGSLLAMFSDGLATKTSLNAYTGVRGRHPQLLAGVLYRDFGRKRDDATVLVSRLERAQPC